jgi:DNA repair protein RecO (recombination protein O)
MDNAFSDLGIVLKTNKTGESDKIITILSKYHGLVALRAPGARKMLSKKTGHLDSLNLIKFHVARSHHPQILTQAETEKNFINIKNDLDLTQKALFCTEIINQITPPNEPDQSLFYSLDNLLTFLNSNKKIDDLMIKFLSFLLRHFGYSLPKNKDLISLTAHTEEIIGRRLKSTHI